MSWHIHLVDDRGHEEGWWNYTHNINGMINEALIAAGAIDPDEPYAALWRRLRPLNGAKGGELIHKAAVELKAHPEKHRAMNPENGWGNYDEILAILEEMERSIPEWPCVWKTSG